MKLTPFAKFFITVVMLAAVGYVLYMRAPGSGGAGNALPPGPAASPANSAPPPGSGATVAMRLCGSNTMGATLMPELVAAFLRQQGDRDVVTVPGQSAEEVTVRGVSQSDGSTRLVQIQSHGSGTAFAGLSAGSCDLGMSSRRIKPEEIAALARLGDMTSPACEHIVGLDGMAIIVHQGNPVSALTLDKLARVFTGQISDWKEVGGTPGPIHLYRRDDQSGTMETFKALVLGGRAMAPSATTIEDSRQLADRVAGETGAIGFVGIPYLQGVRALAISESGSRALVPNRLTVATEDYPLTRRLYLYSAASPPPLVRRLIDFTVGKAGQDVVAAAGFVSQNVTAVAAAADKSGPPEYRRLSANAERLSLNLRFRSGKTQFDNKALLDLDRAVTFISDLHYTGEQVMVFGFADGRGTPDVNLRLSKERAEAVASAFQQRGIKPAVVTGFGAELPVAANDSEEGRERNRRVEIWIHKR